MREATSGLELGGLTHSLSQIFLTCPSSPEYFLKPESMRKAIFITLFMMLGINVSAQKLISVTPYGGIGLNLLPPTLSDLQYVGISGEEVRRNIIVSDLGVQFLAELGERKVGVDFGGGTLFVNRVILDQGVGTSNHLDQEWDIYLKAYLQQDMGGDLFWQLGLGPHFTPWYYSYYYESNNYTDVYDQYGGIATTFGIVGAVGSRAPLSSTMSLQLMAKLDIIFQYGIMVPFTVTAGLTFDK